MRGYDVLREKSVVRKLRLIPGAWYTSNSAYVRFVSEHAGKEDRSGYVNLQIDEQWNFNDAALRELAAFCNELADQIGVSKSAC